LVVRQRRLLYLLPEGRRLNRVCAGWLVSHAIEVAFPREAGGVYVLQGREWEWGTNDLTSCVHYALQCFSAVFSTATAPHSDAAGQDAFNGAPVECVQDGYGSFRSLELADASEVPMGFLR